MLSHILQLLSPACLEEEEAVSLTKVDLWLCCFSILCIFMYTAMPSLLSATDTSPLPQAFALSLGPDYLRVIQPSVSSTHISTQLVRLSLSTEGNIPLQPDDFISSNTLAGFGWTDLTSGMVFAITLMPIPQTPVTTTTTSPYQQAPNLWQAHRLMLSGGQSYPQHDYCLASIDQNPLPNVQISITDNILNVQASRDQIPFVPESFITAFGFTLQHDSSCSSGFAVQISG